MYLLLLLLLLLLLTSFFSFSFFVFFFSFSFFSFGFFGSFFDLSALMPGALEIAPAYFFCPGPCPCSHHAKQLVSGAVAMELELDD